MSAPDRIREILVASIRREVSRLAGDAEGEATRDRLGEMADAIEEGVTIEELRRRRLRAAGKAVVRLVN